MRVISHDKQPVCSSHFSLSYEEPNDLLLGVYNQQTMTFDIIYIQNLEDIRPGPLEPLLSHQKWEATSQSISLHHPAGSLPTFQGDSYYTTPDTSPLMREVEKVLRSKWEFNLEGLAVSEALPLTDRFMGFSPDEHRWIANFQESRVLAEKDHANTEMAKAMQHYIRPDDIQEEESDELMDIFALEQELDRFYGKGDALGACVGTLMQLNKGLGKDDPGFTTT